MKSKNVANFPVFLLAIVAIVSGIAAWWIVGFTLDQQDTTIGDPPPPSPERISLLGNHDFSGSDLSAFTHVSSFTDLQAMLAKIDSVSTAELKHWFLSLVNSSNSSHEVTDSILARLTATDPEGMLEYVLSNPKLESFKFTVLREWAQFDPIPALEAAFDLDPRGLIAGSILSVIDPEASEEVYQLLLERGYDKGDTIFERILPLLATTDPEEAAERAIEFTLGLLDPTTSSAFSDVIEQWHEQDPDAVSEWLMVQDDPKRKVLALRIFANKTIEREGVEGLDRVWPMLDESERHRLASDLPLPSEDTDAALEWMDIHVDSSLVYGEMLSSMAKRVLKDKDHPEKIVGIVSRLDTDYKDKDISSDVRQISRIWAQKNIESLNNWIDTLGDTSTGVAARTGVLNHWLAEDPLKAIDYWKEHEIVFNESGAQSMSYIGVLVNHMIEGDGDNDPQAMIDALPEAWQARVASIYGGRLAESGPPEDAVRFLEEQPASTDRDGAVEQSIEKWAEQDPANAAKWLEGSEESDSKGFQMIRLVSTWGRTDPLAAQEWLLKQPASAERDQAAPWIAISAVHYPETAFELVQSVSDDETRGHMLHSVVSSLARHDPDLAATHLQAANLAPQDVVEAEEIIKEARAIRASLEEPSSP